MRSVCFPMLIAVVLGVMGAGANADTVDSSAGGLGGNSVVQPAGTGANADTVDASVGDPVIVAAVPPDGQEGAPESDKREKQRIHISVNYYAFLPTDSETRSNFGKVWNSFGIGRFRPERPNKWVFDWDATFWAKDGASDALLIPVTVGVQRGLSRDPDQQSYLAVRVGPYYGKVDDNLMGPDDSKIGGCANVALGLVINRKYVLEARYDWFTKLAGNDLNGLTLTAGVEVFEFSL